MADLELMAEEAGGGERGGGEGKGGKGGKGEASFKMVGGVEEVGDDGDALAAGMAALSVGALAGEGVYARVGRAERALRAWRREDANRRLLHAGVRGWPREDAIGNLTAWSEPNHPARHAKRWPEEAEGEGEREEGREEGREVGGASGKGEEPEYEYEFESSYEFV